MFKNMTHIKPGKVKAQFNDVMGSCYANCPTIEYDEEEYLKDKIKEFKDIVKKELVGQTLSNVCSSVRYNSYDNISHFRMSDVDKRTVPFRIEKNIVLVFGENILTLASGEDSISLEFNTESIDVWESEFLRPIELQEEEYMYSSALLDLSWGFEDLIGVKVKDVFLDYCCGDLSGIGVEFENDFVIYCPLRSEDEGIDCYKQKKK